nr:class I SAM-dependent methyltransferase [Desulfobotulus pelophilus]
MPFVRQLSPAARVFDFGCGCGRDLKFLKEMGFHPEGIERSPELAAIARSYSNCPVHELDFEHGNLADRRAEALLFSGSLVHLTPDEVQYVLGLALPSLTPKGKVYVSLKEGEGIAEDSHGRCFFLWTEKRGSELWDRTGLRNLSFSRDVSIHGTVWLAWVLECGE